MKTSGGRSGSILPCRIRFFRDSTRLIFLLLPSRPRPPAVGTRIRQPRKLAPDCAGLLEALYFLAYCWAETCERRRLCLRGSVLLLPAPGAGPAAAPRARTQLCKHEGAVSTVSLVSPSPVFPVTMVPVSPPIASLSCQAARWGRCGPAAAEYLLSKLPPLQYLDISQNIFYVKNIFV